VYIEQSLEKTSSFLHFHFLYLFKLIFNLFKMKILVVDDDLSISIQLKKYLEKNGFVVDVSNNGSSGLSLALSNVYDLILLDINLPGMDGVSVCANLRSSKIYTPIIFLTVKNELSNKIRSFNIGCDDYIVKPFSMRELILRINAISRRSKVLLEEVLEYEDLKMNLLNKEVYRNNKLIILSKKEFLLLKYLMLNIGSVLSRDNIFDNVWDMNANPASNIVEVYINKLRKKIDYNGAEPFINNLLGMGYYIGKKRYC